MLPENNTVYSQEQKIELLENFINIHPGLEVQDLYKWLYYGEFGPEENKSITPAERHRRHLQSILDDLESECMKDLPDTVWDPVGMSGRFIMVYLSAYEKKECPLNRITNLLERAPAFVGSRMQFKLDWTLIKDHSASMESEFRRQDFTNFEDKINFYQLPELPFSSGFREKYPIKYRIVPASLFFEYFPEFMDEEILKNISDKTHLFD